MTGPPFYKIMGAMRKSSCLQDKGSTLFLSDFKTVLVRPRELNPRPFDLQ